MRIDVQVSVEDEVTGANVQVTEVAQFAELSEVRALAIQAVDRLIAAAEVEGA